MGSVQALLDLIGRDLFDAVKGAPIALEDIV